MLGFFCTKTSREIVRRAHESIPAAHPLWTCKRSPTSPGDVGFIGPHCKNKGWAPGSLAVRIPEVPYFSPTAIHHQMSSSEFLGGNLLIYHPQQSDWTDLPLPVAALSQSLEPLQWPTHGHHHDVTATLSTCGSHRPLPQLLHPSSPGPRL